MSSPQLTRIQISNFRGIGPGPLAIDLAPLTVLVGPNGSGKSSVLQALALTAQSAVQDPSREDLVLSGSLFDATPTEGSDNPRVTAIPLYFKRDPTRVLSVDLTLRLGGDQGTGQPGSVRYAWERHQSPQSPWQESGPLWGHRFWLDDEPLLRVWSEVVSAEHGSGNIERYGWCASIDEDRWPVRDVPRRVLHPYLVAMPADMSRAGGGDVVGRTKLLVPTLDRLREPARRLTEHLGRVLVLNALRGASLMQREVGPKVRTVGKFGETTVQLLASIQEKTQPAFRSLKEWALRFGLPEIEPGWAGDQQLAISFKDPETGTPLAVDDAPGGSIQGLMLAAHLLLAKPGSTLLIEEPENGMHPAYEKLIADLLVESIQRDHQIVLSTHSEVLVAALGNAVRKSGVPLKARDVAIYHLDRNSDGVSAERIDISDKGYMDGWVRSFAAVDEELASEWWSELPEDGDAPGLRG